jgi:hypothetical protein
MKSGGISMPKRNPSLKNCRIKSYATKPSIITTIHNQIIVERERRNLKKLMNWQTQLTLKKISITCLVKIVSILPPE